MKNRYARKTSEMATDNELNTHLNPLVSQAHKVQEEENEEMRKLKEALKVSRDKLRRRSEAKATPLMKNPVTFAGKKQFGPGRALTNDRAMTSQIAYNE